MGGLLIVAAAIALLACGGAAWQAWGERRDARRFPPLGHMASLPQELGGHRLHFLSAGFPADGAAPRNGQPTVVLEAALGASSMNWVRIWDAVSAAASTIAYDRAGMGWSEAGPLPRTGDRVLGELRALLAAVARPPFVLVGHSYGGLLMRLYAARYPEEVAGLVLVDAAAPEQWIHISRNDDRRLRFGVRLARRGATAARLGVARLVAGMIARGARRSARVAVAAISGGILGPSDRGLLTPVRHLTAEMRRALPYLWTQPKYYAALASQLEVLPALAAEVARREAVQPRRSFPVIVISASDPSPERVREQEAAARLSSRGRHVIAPTCGHWIQLDQPQCVIAAIREVLAVGSGDDGVAQSHGEG